MKIGILTQPLEANYGGLLQAYALQTVLERMGYDVVFLNRLLNHKPDNSAFNLVPTVIRFIKNVVKFILHRPLTIVYHEIEPEQWIIVERFTVLFVNRYLHKSPNFNSTEEISDFCKENGIKIFIVGSDQCWRPLYSPCLPNYFLDFAKKWDVRRIAYAASFGVDNWEYSDEMTKTCAHLAQKFDAISVREESAIGLCKEHLGVDAIHVLDPTMLLDKEDYNKLVDNFNFCDFDITPEHSSLTINRIEGRALFNYILDQGNDKKLFIEKVANYTGLTPVYCMPKKPHVKELIENCPDDCTFPPVELWLQSFRDSEMVIADSFHGVVFSIIYNKPFWVLANPGRGIARITSLLKMFDLEERLVTPEKFAKIDCYSAIDWDRVNAKRKSLKEFSLDFLKNNLK